MKILILILIANITIYFYIDNKYEEVKNILEKTTQKIENLKESTQYLKRSENLNTINIELITKRNFIMTNNYLDLKYKLDRLNKGKE